MDDRIESMDSQDDTHSECRPKQWIEAPRNRLAKMGTPLDSLGPSEPRAYLQSRLRPTWTGDRSCAVGRGSQPISSFES